jgi:hypothetical protein
MPGFASDAPPGAVWFCSICQSVIHDEEPTHTCDLCAAVYHRDCWKSNDGCGTYGCRRAPDTHKVEVTGELSVNPEADAWGDTKLCPRCGEHLIASALKCPKCNAKFDTRAPMSPEDYQAQEAHHAAVRRNTLAAVAVFAASALGFLAPVTLCLSAAGLYARRHSRRGQADTAKVLMNGALALSIAYVVLLVAVFGLGW